MTRMFLMALQRAMQKRQVPTRHPRADGGTRPVLTPRTGMPPAMGGPAAACSGHPGEEGPSFLSTFSPGRPGHAGVMLPFAQASAHGVHSLSAVDAMKLLTHSKATLLRPLAGAFLAAALAGCTTLAPDYQRPAAPVAAQWPTPTTAGAPSSAAADLPWQALFADPKLRSLIDLALQNNRDMRVAALNVEKARAQYRIQRSDLVPQIGVTGQGSSGRTPASISSSGVGGVSHAYYLDVGISSYELDLFGRVRSLKDEALQTYLATDETRRATHISLISQVAGSYLSLAADLDLQRLAHDTLRSRQDAYDLQQDLVEIGNASQLELRQAESELESARADALTTDNQVAADRNALELLVGAPLSTDLLPGTDALTRMLSVHEIPAGLPSDLLRSRPDILSAEHTLMGANANIGAARAAFFPTISLTGGLGRASNELSSLFDAGGRYWTFVPQITVPIFSGGRLTAQLEVSKVDRDIAVAQYEQAIQTAFREVADALAKRSVVDGQLAAQRKRAVAAQASYDLVQARYEEGVVSYLEVLDAQRTLYSAQQARIQAELAQQTSVVTLYKALGGGLTEASQPASAAVLDGAAKQASVQEARQ